MRFEENQRSRRPFGQEIDLAIAKKQKPDKAGSQDSEDRKLFSSYIDESIYKSG